MMLRLTTSLLAAGLALSAARAATSDPAPPETAGFHLKNRSVFTEPETARPPFWPIGWNKPTGNSSHTNDAPVAAVKLDPDQFNVTSIMLGRPSLAVINGRAYGEGEFLKAARPKDAKDPKPPGVVALPPGAKVQVQKITDGTVTLVAANNQAVVVPLRRPELREHKPEEDPIPLSER